MKTYINSSKSKPVDSNTKHTCGTNETSVPFLANPGRYTSQDERQSCLTPQHILDLMSESWGTVCSYQLHAVLENGSTGS